MSCALSIIASIGVWELELAFFGALSLAFGIVSTLVILTATSVVLHLALDVVLGA
jgi:hypothetical protein